MMSALIICDKWCSGTQMLGVSAWESNLITSLEALKICDVITFHFDEFNARTDKKKSANQELINIISNNSFNFIFLVIYKIPTNSDDVISIESLKAIKKIHLPVVTIFGDLESDYQVKVVNAIEPYVDLILFTALTPPGERINNRKLKYTWVPKNNSIFNYSPPEHKTIDVSYMGSPKIERLKLIKYLNHKNIKITVFGGERNGNISAKKYANYIRKSKISLSFSRNSNCHVINARSFETLACNSMLLEEEGVETPKFFIPFEDYVPYYSWSDCQQKIKYYLQNEEEREEICNNGYKKLNALFSAERFWKEILDHIARDKKLYYDHEFKEADRVYSSVYWSLPFSKRSIPKFTLLNYRNIRKFNRIKYILYNAIQLNRASYYVIQKIYSSFFISRLIFNKIKLLINRM